MIPNMRLPIGIADVLSLASFPDLPDQPVTTKGMARETGISPYDQGGGDLNGTATQVLLLGQAGTPGTMIGLPRKPGFSGNYCGVV